MSTTNIYSQKNSQPQNIDKSNGYNADKRYQCLLSNEALAHAVSELNEPSNNDVRLAAIDELRKEFKDQYPNLPLEREDDKFMLRFLRARKFDTNASLALLKNYHIRKKDWTETFEKTNNSELLKQAFRNQIVREIEGKSFNNCCVIFCQYYKNRVPIIDCLALLHFAFDKLLEVEENQIYGFVIIHNLTYATSAKLFDRSTVSKHFYFMNYCIPARLKRVFFANNSPILSTVFELASCFMGEKLKSKCVVVGKNFDAIFQLVDRSLLPACINGTSTGYDWKKWEAKLFN